MKRHAFADEKPSRYAREIEAFADAVAGTSHGWTGGVSERRTVAIIQAGYESIRTGLPVDLAQRFGAL